MQRLPGRPGLLRATIRMAAVPLLLAASLVAACGGTPNGAAGPRGRPTAPSGSTANTRLAGSRAAARSARRHAAARTAQRAADRAATCGAPAAGQPIAGTAVPGAPNCPMLPASNIWNTDVSRQPVDRHSAAWLRSLNATGSYLHPDFGPNPGGYPYGIPFIVVTNAHPKLRISFQYASESDRGPYPFGPDTPIEGGKHATGDRHALMVDSSTCTLYELWDARYSSRHATAGSGAIWSLRSNALRPAGWTSADAAGLPILPGLLNFAEVQRATATGVPIMHAIRFTAQRTRSGFVWPARHQAG